MKLKKGTRVYIGGKYYVGPGHVPDELIPEGLKDSKIWEPSKSAVKKSKNKNDD